MGDVMPTASEYLRYVSIDATTMRASTVTRSMPTNETRTHASITIPLSRTRSRTSMRELPLGVRSTAISSVLWARVSRLEGAHYESDHDLRDDLGCGVTAGVVVAASRVSCSSIRASRASISEFPGKAGAAAMFSRGSFRHQLRPICSALSIEQMSNRTLMVSSSTFARLILMSPAI